MQPYLSNYSFTACTCKYVTQTTATAILFGRSYYVVQAMAAANVRHNAAYTLENAFVHSRTAIHTQFIVPLKGKR